MTALAERAAQLYPRSPAMQAKWIAAREAADRIHPHFAKLLPLTRPVPQFDQQFAVRSLREIA